MSNPAELTAPKAKEMDVQSVWEAAELLWLSIQQDAQAVNSSNEFLWSLAPENDEKVQVYSIPGSKCGNTCDVFPPVTQALRSCTRWRQFWDLSRS